MLLDEDAKTPQIDYPCEWQYKLIGVPESAMRVHVRAALASQLPGRNYELTLSNQSRAKKYTALNLVVVVQTEQERDALYTAFKDHTAIKMIL